jgi:hypothetical protein
MSRITRHLGGLRGGSPREESFAGETLAHVLTNDDEYLANLVAASGAYVSLSFFVSSHVERQPSTVNPFERNC